MISRPRLKYQEATYGLSPASLEISTPLAVISFSVTPAHFSLYCIFEYIEVEATFSVKLTCHAEISRFLRHIRRRQGLAATSPHAIGLAENFN